MPGACALRVEARSNLLTDLVAQIRDAIEVRIDPATGRPLSFSKRLHEGDAHREFEVLYLWNAGTSRQDAGGGAPLFLAGGGRYDPLSVLYHFRYRPYAFAGTVAALPVSDGKRVGEARAVYVGRETLHMAGRFIDVLAFDYDQGGTDGLFRMAPGASVRLWVTNDAMRIPVLIRARIVIAGFQGEFTGMLLRAEQDGKTVLEF